MPDLGTRHPVEQQDNHGYDPREVVLPADGTLNAEFGENLLDGVAVLCGPAEVRALALERSERLYR
jgi:hypothetical protein